MENAEIIAALTSNIAAPESPDAELESSDAELSAGDVVTGAITNFPSSFEQLGKDVIQPFLDPVGTAESLYELGKGVVQLAIPGEQGNEETARRVGQFFADRYGGLENIKRTIATDPAGFLADLSLVATGGVGALTKAGKVAKISGKAIEAGQKAGKVTRLVDPITATIAGATKAGGQVLSSTLGGAAGVGAKPIQVAFQAGRAGGEKAKAFLDHLLGKAPIRDLVESGRAALKTLVGERRTAYLARMEKLGEDLTPLSLDEVDKVVSEMRSAGKHKLGSGREVDIRGETPAATLDKIEAKIAEFRGADGFEVLTATDLDAMKQAVGEIRDKINIKDDPTSWNLANQVYGSIRRTIVKQDTDYADIMKQYEEATDLITEIENTFNMKGKRGRVDSQVRQLTSIMRDNVNTAYGYRGELADTLASAAGGERLLEQAAGATLRPLRSRGLANLSQMGVLGSAAVTANPALLAMYPATMPKVVGGGAYLAGKASKYAGAPVRGAIKAAPASFQAGRASRESQPSRDEMLSRLLSGVR